jgi:hypothetical protein
MRVLFMRATLRTISCLDQKVLEVVSPAGIIVGLEVDLCPLHINIRVHIVLQLLLPRRRARGSKARPEQLHTPRQPQLALTVLNVGELLEIPGSQLWLCDRPPQAV